MVMPVRKQPSAVPSGHTGPPTTTAAAAAASPSLPAPSLLETDFRSSSISKVHDWSLEVEEEEEWNNQRRRMSESSEQVWPLLASRSVSMFSRTTRLRILEKLFFAIFYLQIKPFQQIELIKDHFLLLIIFFVPREWTWFGLLKLTLSCWGALFMLHERPWNCLIRLGLMTPSVLIKRRHVKHSVTIPVFIVLVGENFVLQGKL